VKRRNDAVHYPNRVDLAALSFRHLRRSSAAIQVGRAKSRGLVATLPTF
jgi:hypothetical protein